MIELPTRITKIVQELADAVVNVDGYADDPTDSDRCAEQRDELAGRLTDFVEGTIRRDNGLSLVPEKTSLPASLRRDLEAVLDYAQPDEERDFAEWGTSRTHIVLAMRRLREALLAPKNVAVVVQGVSASSSWMSCEACETIGPTRDSPEKAQADADVHNFNTHGLKGTRT